MKLRKLLEGNKKEDAASEGAPAHAGLHLLKEDAAANAAPVQNRFLSSITNITLIKSEKQGE